MRPFALALSALLAAAVVLARRRLGRVPTLLALVVAAAILVYGLGVAALPADAGPRDATPVRGVGSPHAGRDRSGARLGSGTVSLGALAASLLAAASLTPQEQASLVVVSGLPAPPGVGGVLVQRWNTRAPRPEGALVFMDQEGGEVRAYRDAPPSGPASSYTSTSQAHAAGRATRRALRARGVHVDLAPVLDLRGPLGSRHFRRPDYGLAFARGLGDAACVKHFPGLGTAAISTDDRPHVDARVRAQDLAPFRAAIRAGVPCVMTSNAFYDGAPYRASISPDTYRRLRALGFDGVAITDSLSIVRVAPVERWSRQAIRAGADLLLFTSGVHARRAIAALLQLARAGELDTAVARVLRYRARYGVSR